MCRTTEANRYLDNPNCTFLGGRCDQPWTAFYVWELFFMEYGQRLKRFIEFGCDMGHTSTYFALWCLNLGAEYTGYDKRDRRQYKSTPVQRLVGLHTRMRIGNGYMRADEIRGLVRSKGMTCLFTDCIDKPWEFKTFAPMLKPGDVLAVHDWDRAVYDEWVAGTMQALEPYKLLYETERLELHTLTRFFRKE